MNSIGFACCIAIVVAAAQASEGGETPPLVEGDRAAAPLPPLAQLVSGTWNVAQRSQVGAWANATIDVNCSAAETDGATMCAGVFVSDLSGWSMTNFALRLSNDAAALSLEGTREVRATFPMIDVAAVAGHSVLASKSATVSFVDENFFFISLRSESEPHVGGSKKPARRHKDAASGSRLYFTRKSELPSSFWDRHWMMVIFIVGFLWMKMFRGYQQGTRSVRRQQ